MGFDSPARGRGRGRGGFSGDGSYNEGGYKARGGSPNSGFRGRGGGGRGHGFKSPDNRRGGGDRGRGFYGNKSGAVSQNYRGGRGSFSPRGGRGNLSPHESFSPRGGRGNFTYREGGSPHGGRGSFTPRGGRKDFTPRGGRGSSDFRGMGRGMRGSFSEKRKAFTNGDEDDININNHKAKKARSAANTPTYVKKTPKRAREENESVEEEEEEEEVVAPVSTKKEAVGKPKQAAQEEESDSDDEDEEEGEDEESEDDEGEEMTPVALQKQSGVNARSSVTPKKSVMLEESEDDEEEEDEEISEDEDEEEDSSDEHEGSKSNLKEATSSKNVGLPGRVEPAVSDEDDDEEDEEDEDEEMDDDDEESDEDEEQVEPIMKTPAVKSNQTVVKSALKSEKSTSVKKSVNVSAPATPITASKKLPVTPHPQKKELLSKETPKATLNFGDDSSDDEEDEEDEESGEDEAAVDDEEASGDSDEEGDEDEEEDEEEEEETPKHLSKKAGGVKALPKKAEEVQLKVVGKEEPPQQQGVKRKANIDDRDVKHVKLDENLIIEEENRRRQERDERSLFIKGFPKNTKTKELQDLHADIETVRHQRGSSFAWLIFRNEAACKKAHSVLSKAKVGGKDLTVDFCGSKSSKAPEHKKKVMPLNPLELYINGLPANVTKEDIRNVFRAAVSINIPNARLHDLRRAFVLFSNEDDAKMAFEKGKGLKLAGRSVEVFYARLRKDVLADATVKPTKSTAAVQNTSIPSVKKNVGLKVEESDESDEEDMESSNEGIEEVAKAPTKKAAVGKSQLEPESDDEEDDDEDDDDEDEEEEDESEEGDDE